jgi:hypothetical protein
LPCSNAHTWANDQRWRAVIFFFNNRDTISQLKVITVRLTRSIWKYK